MAGHVPWSAVINLSNSIIGVSILAMPWCFRECGVIFGIALLAMGGFLTKTTCYMLLRASKVSRKHSYEFLANHALGAAGKMAVELCIIGLLVCTCIAFFVIIGDLAPSIVSKWLGLQNSWHLRTCLLCLVAVFIVLPLGMKRSVESLGGLSMLSITFYLLFTTDIIVNSIPHLLGGQWIYDINLWRLPGMLKGISIFSMSMCCQTTLFVVYDSLKEKTVKQMEAVVSKSINMVATMYVMVGFFGYVCYYKDASGVKGDVLLNFTPSLLSEILRLGFTVSVALSFPLCIFPCRASIYTLFCNPVQSVENPHGGGDFIPPAKFKVITVMIVSVTLMVGITIPNVEIILGLTGATMGSLIGFIIPAIIYLRTTGVPNKNNAKIVLVVGVLLLVCSTYDNLSTTTATPELDLPHDVEKIDPLKPIGIEKDGLDNVNNLDGKKIIGGDDVIKDGDKEAGQKPEGKEDAQEKEKEAQGKDDNSKDVQVDKDQRQEPPIPHAPDSKEKEPAKVEKSKEKPEEEKPAVVVFEEKREEEGVKRDLQDKPKEDKPKEVKSKEDDDDDDIGAADFDGETGKDKEMVKKVEFLEKENEKKKLELVEKEEQLKVKEEHLEKIVEVKVAEQEQKQEEQKKKLDELEERQKVQEKIIEAQAEAIENLKVQHPNDLNDDILGVLDAGQDIGDQLAGGQLAGGPLGGGNLQQPDFGGQPQVLVPQQQQQQQQQQQFVPIQQQGAADPLLNLQPQDAAGKAVFQQGVGQQQVLLQPGLPQQPGILQQQPGIPQQQNIQQQQAIQQQQVIQQQQNIQQQQAIQQQQVIPQQQNIQQQPGIPQQQNIQQQQAIQQQQFIPQQQGFVQQQVIPQQGIPLPVGQGLAPLQPGLAPLPGQEPVDNGRIVKREVHFDPQLQQHQGADIRQPQFQQWLEVPDQQMQQLNMAGNHLLQPNNPGQQPQQLNVPVQQVAGDAIMMQGAVAQQRQLLQGDAQSLVLDDQGKGDTANLAKGLRGEEVFKDEKANIKQEAKVHKEDEKKGIKEEEDGKLVDEGNVQEDEEDKQAPGYEQGLSQDQEDKDRASLPKDEDDKKRLNADSKDREAEETNPNASKSVENTGKKSPALEPVANGTINVHSVKFKTRQEMSIKPSHPSKVASQSQEESDTNRESNKSDGNVHLPGNEAEDTLKQNDRKQITKEGSENQHKAEKSRENKIETRLSSSQYLFHEVFNER